MADQIEHRPAYLEQYFPNDDIGEYEIPGGEPIAVLSIEGKNWSVKYQKQVYPIDDAAGHPMAYVDVVVVKAHDPLSKTYYIDEWKADSASPPDCSSIEGKVPDDGVPHPQSEFCYNCEHNKFGTARVGTGKACKDTKRLALLPVDRDGNVVDNEFFGGAMLFRVTPGSFANFTKYLKTDCKAHHRKPHEIVTRLNFVRDQNASIVQFQFVRWLEEEEAAIVKATRADEHTERVLSMNLTTPDEENPASAQAGVAAQPMQPMRSPPPRLAAPAQEPVRPQPVTAQAGRSPVAQVASAAPIDRKGGNSFASRRAAAPVTTGQEPSGQASTPNPFGAQAASPKPRQTSPSQRRTGNGSRPVPQEAAASRAPDDAGEIDTENLMAALDDLSIPE